jgi:hypothetical protein
MDKNVVSSGRDLAKRKLIRDRRKFKLESTEEEFFVSSPTAESIRQSDWIYSKVFSQAMANDILTADQMLDLLRKRGILSPSYDLEVDSIRKQLAENLLSLSAVVDLDEKERLAIKVAGLREELFLLNQKINGPVANTCEQIAEDAKVDYLTSTMIEDEAGKKVWSSYDEYSTDADYELVFKSRVEVMLFLRNVDSDFLENTPEQIALREVVDTRTRQLRDFAEAKKEMAESKEIAAVAEKPVVSEPVIAVETPAETEVEKTEEVVESVPAAKAKKSKKKSPKQSE